ncbi:MAG: GNAT family N-acetyltransferase [Treponema sp.]|nr:GNAT family N-acetyltransferase [Treponema sp.]MCL2250855.1 GNAT family N-acetyltransferase [Treponema sp.]
MLLKYTESGFLCISPEDDCKAIVDAMLKTDYSEEFCISNVFEADFIAKLMEAGFLVMSIGLEKKTENPVYLLLPKLHLVRSALFFDNLHVKKSIRRLLNRYELRADAEFERIVDRCVEKHGTDWLTPPLVDCIKQIRIKNKAQTESLLPASFAYPASFGLYRDGCLVAGEFGVVCGNVYTSYSGYFDEDNAGTVQIILAARYLEEHGFSFFDLGMPLEYKKTLGAVDISPLRFVQLFRRGNAVKRINKFK